ncbi:hypothetical protein DE146DRAFT_150765 [Phaeosphaeria sp. MPI-PUGE-AT-0046c]|nr:hypothetical protein DE146DRAFT_150765 [Phaeosphaeria sp. MPI-PUGE-AT-0046c]
MAHQHPSLQEDWGDLGSSHGEQTAYSSRVDSRSRNPPTAQQILGGATHLNHYPSSEDANAIATQTGLLVDTTNIWHRHLSLTKFEDTGAYRLSDYSEFTNTPAALSPLGPNSVQSVVQYNSSWVDVPYDHNSALWPDDSLQPTLDGSLDQAPITLSNYGTEDDPYYPGARLDRPDPSHTITDYSHLVDQSTPNITKYDETTYHVPRYPKAATVTDSLHPGTVTSEARSFTRSYKKHPSVSSQSGLTTCNQCGAEFSGRYQRGNCARHVRQQHSEKEVQVSMDCVCRVCKQEFKRQDARRKHEWKKHGLEDTKPLSRRPFLPRRPLAQDSSSHAGTYDTPSEEGTLTCPPTTKGQNTVEARYCVPDPSYRAYEKFSTARKHLDNEQYNIFCDVVLARGKYIVERLRSGRSSLHDMFSQELRGLSKQLLRRQQRSLKVDPDTEEDQVDAQSNADSQHGGNSCSRLTVGNAPSRRRASTASSRFNPYPRRSSKKSDEDPLLAILRSSTQQEEEQSLDCPIHKWHLMHRNESPCNGCGKPYMNGVRQHLLPTYSQQHRGNILFMQRCDTCKEDFIDEALWNRGRHDTGNCVARSQPKGNNLMCWARLFLKIYPEEHRIPSPYRNDHRLLPNQLVVRLRHELGLTQSNTAGQQPPQRPQHEAETSYNPRIFESFDADLERMATVDTLVARCTALLAQLLAYQNGQAADEHVNIAVITAYYHDRLERLRQEQVPPMAQSQQNLEHVSDQMSLSLPSSHQALPPTASFIGGAADFTMPNYGLNPFINTMPVPQSETGTQPSSQGYASFGFPSFLAPSSQTDYDFSPPTYMDPPQSSGTQFYAGDDDAKFDPSPSDHTQGQWPLLYDAYLDVPGNSRVPHPPANAQLFSDIDQMLGSPSDSHYAMSSFAPDDRSGLPDID